MALLLAKKRPSAVQKLLASAFSARFTAINLRYLLFYKTFNFPAAGGKFFVVFF